jgi:hypothetical protein
MQVPVNNSNAKDIGDTWMAFEKLRDKLTGEASLLIHSKITSMKTDEKMDIFFIEQQIDKEKMALDKIQRYKDQLLTGISTLIAFSLSNIAALVFGQILKNPAAYEHPEDLVQNITDDMMSAARGPMHIAKAAYENPGGFLNVTYHNITSGTEKLGETALEAVESPSQATVTAAQMTIIILLCMACRLIWRSSACFRCRVTTRGERFGVASKGEVLAREGVRALQEGCVHWEVNMAQALHP